VWSWDPQDDGPGWAGKAFCFAAAAASSASSRLGCASSRLGCPHGPTGGTGQTSHRLPGQGSRRTPHHPRRPGSALAGPRCLRFCLKEMALLPHTSTPRVLVPEIECATNCVCLTVRVSWLLLTPFLLPLLLLLSRPPGGGTHV